MSAEQYEKMRTDRKNALYAAVTDVLDVLEKIGEQDRQSHMTWTSEDVRAFALTLLIDQQRKYTQ